jgi:hypothetical protein
LGVAGLTFLYLVFLPAGTTLAIRWDPTGALAGAVGAAITLASVVAPTLSGVLVQGGSFTGLAWFALACAGLAPFALMRGGLPAGLPPPALPNASSAQG